MMKKIGKCIPEPDGYHLLTAHEKSEFANIVLGVAAQEQTLTSEETSIVNYELNHLMPLIYCHWRSLILFKAVARYADRNDLELSGSMKQPGQSWERSVLISVMQKYESKEAHKKVLTETAKAIRQKRNPFGDAEPEIRDLLTHAFAFTHWDSTKRQNRSLLRSDIREAISNYAQSMITLACSYQEIAK